MIKRTIIILWLLGGVVSTLTAQLGFRSVYFEEYSAQLLEVIVDSDSTVVLYGVSRDTFAGPVGIKFVRLDTFGNILSEKLHIDSSVILTTMVWRQGLIRTQDGGFAIAGATWTVPGVPYLLKVHADLSLDFIEMYPFSNNDVGNSALLELTSGGYMLVQEQITGDDNRDLVVIKTDEEGNQLWRKTYGDDVLQEAALGVKEFTPNKFIINGSIVNSKYTTQATYGKSLILEIDSLGNEIEFWTSSKDYAMIYDYTLLPDSSWICASGTWEYAPQYGSHMSQPVIFRMDKDRNVMWEKKLGRLYINNQVQSIVATPDGLFLATGYMALPGTVKAVHYKFKANGDSLWMRLDSAYVDNGGLTYPKTKVIGSALLSSGSIVSVGYAERATPFGLQEVGFVMKMSPDGCVDTLNCWVVPNTEPFVQVDEVSVYPNPFSDYLTVSISDYPQNAYIYFYDVMGRFLRKERVRLGRNELTVSDFKRGMIFYEVRDGGVVLGRGKLVKEIK